MQQPGNTSGAEDRFKNFLVIKNYLSDEYCDKIVKYLESDEARAHQNLISNEQESLTSENIVNSRHVLLPLCPNELRCDLLNLTFSTLCEVLSENYQVTFESTDPPHFITYPTGGHMDVHIDSGYINEKQEYVEIGRRDYSFLIYLNDDFEGGNIVFPKQQFYLPPQKGMLVAYPGNEEYPHGVMPVTKGTRHVFVVCSQKTCDRSAGKHPMIAINQSEIGKIPKNINQSLGECYKDCKTAKKISKQEDDLAKF